MKIVRVIARLNVGGPAQHVVWLTREMAAAGHHAVLVAGSVPPGETDMAYFAAQNRVEPIIIPEMSRELSLRDLSVVWKLLRLFWRERPDVIHTHTAKAGAVGRAAAFLYRLAIRLPFTEHRTRPAVVHTYHGHVFHSYYGRLRTRIFLAIERLLARVATDRIVVLSPQQLQEIHGHFKVGRRAQFAIVRLGLDLTPYHDSSQRRAQARAALRLGEQTVAIGIVGRLTAVKNHRLFMRAAASLIEQRGTRSEPCVHFLVVGGGHLECELKQEARALGIQDWLMFLGDRNDLGEIYPALDIVALSSLNEGTPLTLIEAMASGRSVVSTAVGGVIDLMGREADAPRLPGITVHATGLLVHAQSPDTLAAAFDYLVDRPGDRLAMGRRGAEFVEATYDLSRLVNDLKQLYEALAPSGANGSMRTPLDSWETTSTYSRLGERA